MLTLHSFIDKQKLQKLFRLGVESGNCEDCIWEGAFLIRREPEDSSSSYFDVPFQYVNDLGLGKTVYLAFVRDTDLAVQRAVVQLLEKVVERCDVESYMRAERLAILFMDLYVYYSAYLESPVL